MDAVLPRRATHSLMSVADCYVSLHRSEGFGLTMAEAMYCGKPVIATAYSGNVDFMTHENSFLIPYRLIEIDRDHGPYKAGYEWADPDVDRAVEVMRYVEKNRAAAAAVGERGRAHVSANLAPAAIGEQLRKRLDELGFAPSERYPANWQRLAAG
jgi:glycosyltransferase involved in cell wall biosynthesis